MPKKKSPALILDAAIKNEKSFMNGLTESINTIYGTNSTGTPLSQSTPLFHNNRWYLVSNMRQMLSQIYVELGLVQTIVDIPVDDALRGGVTFKSEELSEKELRQLTMKMAREKDLITAGQSAKWNRLFGGAGIMIMSGQNPSTQLNVDALDGTDKLDFRAVDMWELFWSKQNTSDYATAIDGADFVDPETYNYYGLEVDSSRVMKLVGYTAPSFIRPRLRGWGLSVVEALVRSINQYLKATDLGYEVLDEFKIDIYKLKNYANTLLQPGGANKVRERVQLTNWTKNYQHAVLLDSEDSYDSKQLSFTGIAEAMSGIRMQVASDMRIPITKLFGTSAAGFNSGEDDIEIYNAMIESQVREKIQWDILRMGELRCMQLFGMIPQDLELEFQSLRILGAEAEENIKTQQFNRVSTAKQNGDITTLEYRESINKADLLPIKLDTSNASILEIDSAQDEDDEESSEGAPSSGKSATKAKETPEAKT